MFGYDPTSRAFDPILGGGALLDIGIYSLWWTTFALGPVSSVSARGTLAPTGVEETTTVVTEHEGGGLGTASATMVASTPNLAAVSGEKGRIELDRPFWEPGGFRVTIGDEQQTWTDPSTLRYREGLAYQATAVAAHVAGGLLESPLHPHARSLELIRIIDDARRQVGAR